MAREAVLLNPYQPYAIIFIEKLFRDYGIRTIAIHSHWRARLTLEGRLPILRSEAVSAHYMLPAAGWAGIVEQLRRRHDVVAVLPHDEGAVEPLAALAAQLGLSWAQPEVLPAFRDKAALKRLIRRNDPGIRLNAHRIVGSAQEAITWRDECAIGPLVLKPNDGSGIRDVAFFDADARVAELEDYFDRVGGAILAEEFIAGQEYWVDGQMDDLGRPEITGIGQYRRGSFNGRANISLGGQSIPTGDPLFAELASYAERVLLATGLRRSPFHLEAKVDADGPCLLEVAARLAGDLFVLSDEWQHGNGLDLLDVAVFHYLSPESYGPLALDWHHYDTHRTARINGVSEVRGRVVAIHGVAEAEAMPSFLFWTRKPHVGQTLEVTDSSFNKPWGLVLQADSRAELEGDIERVRALLILVGESDPAGDWRVKRAMYRARANKYWSSRPRPYMARALRTARVRQGDR